MKRFFIVITLLLTAFTLRANTTKESMKLWYDSDAGSTFTNALPIGNGYMGGMIYGGVSKDYIGLNEGTVWSGDPGNNNKMGAADKLSAVRNALFSGDYRTAESIASDMVGYQPASYQPVGDLVLSFPDHKASSYRRELDLSTAIAKTIYTYDGVEYTREYFASYPDHVMVIRLTANKSNKITFNATLTTPHRNNSLSTVGNTILLQNGTLNSIKFQTRLLVRNDGGSISAANNTISVSDANSVTLILTIASNFKSFNDVTANPSERTEAIMSEASEKNYDDLKNRHLKDYQALFNRVKMDLGEASSNATDITSNRVKNFNSTNDPDFVRLYYQFGRYLLISCSRGTGQPANLQGIWNRDTSPAWGSKYTTNINLEMNYWMVESANLSECATPLINKIKSMVYNGNETAKVHWGTSEGWVVHHNTDLWNRTAPIDGSWGIWPSGAGWLSTHLWEHYLYTLDKEFLKDVYPTMKGAAQFFLNTLVQEPVSGNGYLVTAPSDSPENTHGGYNTCFGPTMDIQIIRDVFSQTSQAAQLLGVDSELCEKMAEASAKLPPHKIGKYGQLQEWFDDWDDPRSDHRHVSHLYGLFPSAQISVDDTADLAEAAKTTLTQRGDMATGWSLAWKINLWARLQDGNHAYKLIQDLLTPDRTYENLFDAHPPFQIDGNFGAVSGINEMLLQSQGGKIRILPALPNTWSNGYVSGLCARGGFVIDSMAWKDGKLSYLSVVSNKGEELSLDYKGKTFERKTKVGDTLVFDANLKCKDSAMEPQVVPGHIEAEEYFDMDGIEIEPDDNNDLNIGWINDSDWSSYLLDVTKSGLYQLTASVATDAEESSVITVTDSTGKVLSELTVDPDQTSGWHDWYNATSEIHLSKGIQTLTMNYNGNSTFLMNVNWFEWKLLKEDEETSLYTPLSQQSFPAGEYALFSLQGNLLQTFCFASDFHSEEASTLLKARGVKSGVYLIRNINGKENQLLIIK